VFAGDESSLPFPLLVSVRWYRSQSRTTALFAIIAIATSVAMATALEMSTRSVRAELDRTADAIAGAAQLEVTAGGVGVGEDLIPEVLAVPGVAAASPLIDWTVRVREGPLEGRSLHILGVDLLADRKVRNYTISDGTLEVADPMLLMADPLAVIVTEDLMEDGALESGGVLPVRSELGDTDLKIRGVLKPGGVADAFGGQVAAMDVYAVQALLPRGQRFDRIDVVLEREADLEQVLGALEKRMDGRATARRSRTRGEYAESAFGTLALAVWVVAVVGVLVSAFLSYSAMARTVAHRTQEFALLQTVGMEPSQVRRMVRIDALAVAGIGTALGFLGGLALSGFFLSMFSGLSELIQSIDIAEVRLTWTTVAVSLFVGLFVGFSGSIGPSRRATESAPLDVLRRSGGGLEGAGDLRVPIVVGGIAAGVVAVVWLFPGVLPPLAALGVVFAGALVSLSAFVRVVVLRAARLASGLLERLLPRFGTFAGASLSSKPTETALAVSSLAAVVAALVGIVIVLTSVTVAFNSWLSTRYPGGLMVSASDLFGSLSESRLSQRDIDLIATGDGIADIVESDNAWMLFRGKEVLAIARTMEVMERRGHVPAIRRASAEVARDLAEGAIAVSESFSRRFHIETGDLVELDTPTGPVEFRVAALIRDYVGPSGTMLFDAEVFKHHWARSGAFTVVVWPESEDVDLSGVIRDRVGEDRTLFFTPASDYADYMTRVLGQFIGLLYAVGALASVLAAVTIVNLMVGVVVDRRTELGLLRVAGATRLQLIGIVTTDALLIACSGALIGTALGVVCSDLMLLVVREAMGWTVERSIDWLAISTVASLALGAGLLASMYPARLASSVHPGDALAFE
jgi:putative ABC transport system permease protein